MNYYDKQLELFPEAAAIDICEMALAEAIGESIQHRADCTENQSEKILSHATARMLLDDVTAFMQRDASEETENER